MLHSLTCSHFSRWHAQITDFHVSALADTSPIAGPTRLVESSSLQAQHACKASWTKSPLFPLSTLRSMYATACSRKPPAEMQQCKYRVIPDSACVMQVVSRQWHLSIDHALILCVPHMSSISKYHLGHAPTVRHAAHSKLADSCCFQ